MMNGTLASEMNTASNGFLPSKMVGKTGKTSSVSPAMGLRHDHANSRRSRMTGQALFGGLLDPKSSSLSLKALARAAAFSGKRLVIEIRDENPVKVVRTSIRGM